jgi:hypothetical protein
MTQPADHLEPWVMERKPLVGATAELRIVSTTFEVKSGETWRRKPHFRGRDRSNGMAPAFPSPAPGPAIVKNRSPRAFGGLGARLEPCWPNWWETLLRTGSQPPKAALAGFPVQNPAARCPACLPAFWPAD